MEQDFSSVVNVAAILAAGILIGMLVGYAFARSGQRRQSEGDRIRERVEFDNLRGEYDQYRDKVEIHFKETSEVFQKTTEQYRALYQRIATGAVELCDPEAVKPILATATAAGNAVGDVANAAMTNFPRKSNASPDERLGDALAEMRAEMNELDQAIDDLKADVIAPKREELEKRGLVKESAQPKADKPTPAESTPSRTRPAPADTAQAPARTASELKVVKSTPTIASNDSNAGEPVRAVPAARSSQPTSGNSAVQNRISTPNGAVNDIKNTTRIVKKQPFESGRIISPGSREQSPTPRESTAGQVLAGGLSNKAPVIRLER